MRLLNLGEVCVAVPDKFTAGFIRKIERLLRSLVACLDHSEGESGRRPPAFS